MTRRNFKVTELGAAKRQRFRKYPDAGPLTVVRADPRVMRVALRAAGGDASRLRVQSDGSVIIR